jgi:hypothetical protein
MTTKGIAYYKHNIIEFIIVTKVVNNNPKKVKGIVISLLSIKRDSQFKDRICDRLDNFRLYVIIGVYYLYIRYTYRAWYYFF